MTNVKLLGFSALLGALVVALRLLPGEPIYTDEIGFLILFGRFFADHGKVISLLPQCEFFSAYPPFTWYGVLAIFGLVHDLWIDSYFTVKLFGALGGLVLVVSFCFVYTKLFLQKATLPLVLCDCIGPFLLGTYPLVSTLLRPESIIVAYLIWTSYFILTVRSSGGDRQGIFQLVRPIVHGCLHVSALMLHPVVLFFVPLAISAAWCSFRNLLQRGLCIAFILFGVWESTVYYFDRFSGVGCPEVEEAFRALTTPQESQIQSLLDFISYVPGRISSTLLVFEQMSPDWILLRDSHGGLEVAGVTRGPLTALFILVFLVGGVQLLLTSGKVFVEVARKHRIDRSSLVFCLLILGTTVSLCIRQTRVFYLAAMYVPLFFFLLGLSWRILPWGISHLARRVIRVIVILIVVFSLWILGSNPEVRLLGSHRQALGHLFSPPSKEFRSTIPRNELYEHCGFPLDTVPKHLVLSDSTYLYFRSSVEPFMVDYISGDNWAGDIKDLRAFLLFNGSSGVAVMCDELPATFSSIALRMGDLCCFGSGSLHVESPDATVHGD